MEKLILVIVDDVPKFNIGVKKEETIGSIKDLLKGSLKNYDEYLIKMFANSESEVKVFSSNKYDKSNLKSIWKQMKGANIILTKNIEVFNKTLTGIKDVDLLILSQMNDKTLYNFCRIDKYASKICSDENFWKNRFIKKYGQNAVKYKPTDKSWKDHYSFVHYLVLDTGYTVRIIDKLGPHKIETISKSIKSPHDVREKIPGVYKVSYYEIPKYENSDKIIFISDSLWGDGVYSIGPIEETKRILNAIEEKRLNHSGIIVFRIDNEDDAEIDEDLLCGLDYCNIFRDDYSDSGSDSDNEDKNNSNVAKIFHTDDVTFIFKDIDAESG